MDHTKLTGTAKHLMERMEFDENEQLICEIRKHPVGLVLIYVTGFFVAIFMILAFVILPNMFDGASSGLGGSYDAIRPILALVGGGLALLSLGITAIGAYLYQGNVVLVTNDKIAQVLQKSLFDRKISQLSIGDVQDVTVTQHGILAHLFNYGTVVIETAGEQQNYTFTFAPHPYECAKDIVFAHEENLKLYGN
jgi:uncharacterized membrane protein YdbT with pleckstrin-like domain